MIEDGYNIEKEKAYYDQAQWGQLQSYHRSISRDLRWLLPGDVESILDVGCGDGALTNQLPEGLSIVGLDISETALSYVRKPVVLGSMLKLPFGNKAFDLVMANDVIEHLPISLRQEALGELERTASKYIIVTVPFAELLLKGIRSTSEGREHVNRHFDSFDLGAFSSLFENFSLIRGVLSGDEWEDELLPVEYIKRLRQEADILEADGVSSRLLHVLEIVRVRQAAHICEHPEVVDFLKRRTEIIGLFVRDGEEEIDSLRLDNASLDWAEAKSSAPQCDLLSLKGRDILNYRQNTLPLVSRWPYFFCDHNIELVKDALVIEKKDLIDFKVGFFSPISEGAVLEIDLQTDRPATVSVNFYHPQKSYIPLASREAGAGRSRIFFPIEKPIVCQFGHLFQVLIDTGPIKVYEINIRQDHRSTRMVVEGKHEYISRQIGKATFHTCTSDCEGAFPHWLEGLETIPASPVDFLSTSKTLERLVTEAITLFSSLDGLRPEFDAKHSAVEERMLGELAGLSLKLDGVVDDLRAEFDAKHSALEERMLGRLADLNDKLGSVAERGLIEYLISYLRSIMFRILRMGKRLKTRLETLVVRVFAEKAISDSEGSGVEALVRTSKRRIEKTASGLPKSVTMLVPDDRIDRRVLLEARTLARAGVDVTVIAAPYPGSVDLDREGFPDIKIERIDTSKAASRKYDFHVGRLRKYQYDWQDFYFYARHFLEAAVRNPAELYVAHDLPVLPAAIAAAESIEARLLYDAHELYPEQLHFGKERMELYRAVERDLAAIPDVVITVNESIAKEMSRRYGIEEPKVILNAPDADHVQVPIPRNRRLRDSLDIADNDKVFLYQGALSLNRNLEALVASMAYVASKDIVLVLMGPGEAKRVELEAIANEHGLLNKRVFFLPAVSQAELLQYTAGADVGIIPYPSIDVNTTLCTPNKLFEFLVAGVPILANDLPELRRFVSDKGAGITSKMNTAADIAEAIDEMCSADIEQLRTSVAKLANEMTWQAQEKAVLSVYSAATKDDELQ